MDINTRTCNDTQCPSTLLTAGLAEPSVGGGDVRSLSSFFPSSSGHQAHRWTDTLYQKQTALVKSAAAAAAHRSSNTHTTDVKRKCFTGHARECVLPPRVVMPRRKTHTHTHTRVAHTQMLARSLCNACRAAGNRGARQLHGFASHSGAQSTVNAAAALTVRLAAAGRSSSWEPSIGAGWDYSPYRAPAFARSPPPPP